MTRFLIRLFVRDWEDTKKPDVRRRYAFLGGLTGILLNAVLFLSKLWAGMLSGSVAVTADAFNNLSDAGSSVATLLGFHIASKPPDREHPFGHGRFEYITSLIIAGIILLVGASFFKTSIERIFTPGTPSMAAPVIAVQIAAMLIKLWLYLFYRKLGRAVNAGPMLAASADSLNDVVVTGVALAGALLSGLSSFPFDGIAGLAVSLFILYSAVGVARDTLGPLLGQPPDPSLEAAITAHVLATPGVRGMHDLVIHNYGPGRLMASVHVEMDADDDLLSAHAAADSIEREVLRALSVALVVHIDPMDNDCPETSRLQSLVTDALTAIDPALGLHDFRMTRNDGRTTLRFDVAVPFSCTLSDAQIRERVTRQLAQLGMDAFELDITFDRSYLDM